MSSISETVGSGSAPRYARYSAVAIAFHWTIALLMIGQLGFGLWMGRALKSDDEALRFAAFEAVQTHKAVGLLVLALTIGRLAWRIAHPAPTAPSTMPAWQRAASTLSHWGFYGLMLALPLTGWAMVSTSPEFKSAPTLLFGGPQVPHLPLTGGSAFFTNAHGALVWITIALLVLHVAAAVKHHLVDRDAVLARMIPGVAPRVDAGETVPGEPCDPPARAPWLGFSAIGLVGAAAAAFAALVLVSGAPATRSGAVAVSEIGAPDAVAGWIVDQERSAIRFSGTHSGEAFEGLFQSWAAEITFDPGALGATRIRVVVDVASAATGAPLYDGALPEPDWFDAAAHPQAVFEAASVRAGDAPGAYVAEGALTIKGLTRPVELPFTLDIEGDQAMVRAALTLPRLDFDLGRAADPTGDWVSLEIPLDIEVSATRSQ